MTIEPGMLLGERYRLTSRIATGGMGEVWRAADIVLGRSVAAKLLKPSLIEEPGFLDRFRAEARHTASLAHPGIAGIFDYGEEQHVAYLVMELVDGEPLSRLHGRKLSEALVVYILVQLSEALQHAHEQGVVHRDVKPGNVLVMSDSRVKITDFGISKVINSVPLTEVGQVLGTPAYISPEQAVGDPATSSSDIYSLGVIGYELLAGRRPFVGDTPVSLALAHVHQPPPPLPPAVHPELAAVIISMLAKRPQDRPANAGRIAERLRAIDLAAQPPALEPPALESTVVSPTIDDMAATLAIAAADRSAVTAGPAMVIDSSVIEQDRPVQRRKVAVAIAGLLIFAALVAAVVASAGGDDLAAVPGGTVSTEPAGLNSAASELPGTQGATSDPVSPTQPTVPLTSAPAATTVPPTAAVPLADPDVYIGMDAREAADDLEARGFEVREERVKGAKNTVIDVLQEPDGPTPLAIILQVGDGKGRNDDEEEDGD